MPAPQPASRDSRHGHAAETLALALLLGGALALRLWGIRFGLPHTLARPDEQSVASVATHFLQGHLNPHFFQYPSLYMYAVAALTRVYQALQLAPSSFLDVYMAGRLLTAVMGTLTVACVYRLGRRLFGPAVGTLGGVCLAVAPLHVRDSHFAVTDVAMTFLGVAAVCALASKSEAEQGGQPRVPLALTGRQYMFAGTLAGLAAATKYNGLLLFAPFLVVVALGVQAAIARRDGGIRRRLLAAAWFPLMFVVAFLLATPFAALDAQRFLHDVQFEARHLSEGHGIALGSGWLYHLRVTLPYGLGLPLLLCAAAGIVLAFVRDIRAALFLFAFPAACYAAAGRSQTVFFRYMIPVVPFLCVAAAVAIDRAGHLLARSIQLKTTGVTPTFRLAAAVATFATVVLTPSALTSIHIDRLLARRDSRVLAAEWMRSALPTQSTIYQTGAEYGQVQATTPEERPRFEEWSYDQAARVFVWQRQPIHDVPDYIVVQRSPLEQYSRVDPRIAGALERHYAPIRRFQGVGMAGEGYDQQDAFYLPMAGFDGMPRPGPTIVVYRRVR